MVYAPFIFKELCIRENVTSAFFVNTKKARLNWSQRQLFPTKSEWIYKMLEACASDNEGITLFIP